MKENDATIVQSTNMDNTAKSEITTLLPVLKDLKRHEKIFLIQFLASELAQQENNLLMSDQNYPVWTPLEAYEASDILMQLLQKQTHE